MSRSIHQMEASEGYAFAEVRLKGFLQENLTYIDVLRGLVKDLKVAAIHAADVADIDDSTHDTAADVVEWANELDADLRKALTAIANAAQTIPCGI